MKKKVLFLLESFDKGGIEKVTLDIVNHLDPEQYDITVQTFWYGGHCQSLVNENVKVIPFFFKHYVKGIIRLIEYLPPKLLYRLFVHGRYDVEIAASDGGAAKVISGSSNKNAKKICWIHMDVVSRGSKLKEFVNERSARCIYNKFDLIVPVSEGCRIRFEEKFGRDYPIKVCRNPMPVDEILKNGQLSSGIFKRNIEKMVFVCVGRLVQQKGFDRLIEACKILQKEKLYQFCIYIIGDGPEKNKISELINKNGLEDIIFLCGFMRNPYPIIREADVFLLSSRDESFSLVVGESLILGTPVIATDCTGISEWLKDGELGLIMENSVIGIVNGMREVLHNPELLSLYRERIRNEWLGVSMENGIKEFEELLKCQNH